MDEKQIVLKAIKDSNVSKFVTVCQTQECKQLIMLEGGCEYYGYKCAGCEQVWCNKHENTASCICNYCGWHLCVRCSINNECEVCGYNANHDCSLFEMRCEHQ